MSIEFCASNCHHKDYCSFGASALPCVRQFHEEIESGCHSCLAGRFEVDMHGALPQGGETQHLQS